MQLLLELLSKTQKLHSCEFDHKLLHTLSYRANSELVHLVSLRSQLDSEAAPPSSENNQSSGNP